MKLNFYKPFNFFNKLVKIKESISTSYLDVVKEMKLIINVFNFNKFNINSFFSIDFMISRYKFIYIAPFYIFYIFSKIVNYEYFFDYTSYSKKYPYFKNKLLNIYWPFKSSYWYFFTPFDFKEFPRKISKKFYVNSTYPKEIVNVVFHWDRDKRRSLEKKSEFNSYTYETIVYKALRDDILSHDDERASAGLHYIGAFAYWLSYERDFDTFYYIITFDGVINWKSFGQPTKDIKFFYVYFKYLEFKLFKLNVKKFKFSKHDFMSFALEKTNFSFFYKQRYNKKKTPGYKFEEGLWLLNFFEKKFTKLTKTYGKKSFFYDFSGKAFWLFNYIEQDYIKKNYNNLFLSTHINYFYHVYNYLMFFAIPFFTIIWHFFTIMFEIMIFFLYIILFFVSDFIMFFIQFFIPVRFIYRIFMFICLGVMFYIFYLLYKINLKPIIDLHNVDDFTEFKYWLIERPKIRVIKEEVIFIFNYWIYFVNMLAFCMPYFYGLNGNFDFFINYSKVAPGLDIFRRLSDYYSKIFGPKFISKKDLYSFEISKARFIDFNLFSKVKEIYYKFIVRFINFFNFVLILRDILFIKSIVYINIIFYSDFYYNIFFKKNIIINYYNIFYYYFKKYLFYLKSNFYFFFKVLIICICAFFIILPFIKFNYFSLWVFNFNCFLFFFFIIYWWFFIVFFAKEFLDFKFFFMHFEHFNFKYEKRFYNFSFFQEKKQTAEELTIEENNRLPYDDDDKEAEAKAKFEVILKNLKTPFYYDNYSKFGYSFFDFVAKKFRIKPIIMSLNFRNEPILDKSTNSAWEYDDNEDEIQSEGTIFFGKKKDKSLTSANVGYDVLSTFIIDLVIIFWFLVFFCKTLDPFHFFYFSEYFHRRSVVRPAKHKLKKAFRKRKYLFNVPFKYQKLSWKKKKILFLGFKESFFYFPIDQYYTGNRSAFPTNVNFYFQKYYYSLIKNFFNLYYSNVPVVFDFLGYYSEFNIFRHKFFNQNWFLKEKFVTDVVDNEFSTRKSKFNIFEERRVSKKKWAKKFKKWLKKFRRIHRDDYYRYYRRYIRKKYIKKSTFYPYYDKNIVKDRHFFYQKVHNIVYDYKKDVFYNFLYKYGQSYFIENKFYEKVIVPSFKKYFLIDGWNFSENTNFFKKSRRIKNRVRIGTFDLGIPKRITKSVSKDKFLFLANFFNHGVWAEGFLDKTQYKRSLIYYIFRINQQSYSESKRKWSAVYTVFSEFELTYLRKKAASKNITVKHPYYLFGEYKPHFAKPKNKYIFPTRNYNLDYYFINIRKRKYYNTFSYRYFRFGIIRNYLHRQKLKKGFIFSLFGTGKINYTYNYIDEQYTNQMRSHKSYMQPIPKKRQFRIPLKTKFIEHFIELNQNKYKKFHINSKKFVTYGDKIKKNYV